MKLFIFGEIKVKYENSAYPADCVKCFSYSSCYNFHVVSEFQSTEFINLVFFVLKFVFKLYLLNKLCVHNTRGAKRSCL